MRFLSIAILALLGSPLIRTSAAAEATPAPRLREVSLAPIVFLPANNAANYVVEQGGLGRLCVQKGAGYFVAPLRVEEALRIRKISVLLTDANATAIGMMSLVHRRPNNFEVLAMTPVSTGSGDVEELSTEEIQPAQDPNTGSYLLQVLLTGPGVCLNGARIGLGTGD